MVAQSPSSGPHINIQRHDTELMDAVTKLYTGKSQEILERLKQMNPAVRTLIEKAIMGAYKITEDNIKQIYEPIIKT